LKDLFREAGTVIRADVAMGYDNRSKGHGTVLFATLEEAKNAIGINFYDYLCYILYDSIYIITIIFFDPFSYV
jgi:hypothetical protein